MNGNNLEAIASNDDTDDILGWNITEDETEPVGEKPEHEEVKVALPEIKVIKRSDNVKPAVKPVKVEHVVGCKMQSKCNDGTMIEWMETIKIWCLDADPKEVKDTIQATREHVANVCKGRVNTLKREHDELTQ